MVRRRRVQATDTQTAPAAADLAAHTDQHDDLIIGDGESVD
jgi:hypothetical protein